MTGSDRRKRRADGRTLAQIYRRFGEAADTSALYQQVAAAVSESDDALRALAAVPARRRDPAFVLAALHDLALQGRAPALASAYETGHGPSAAAAAVDALRRLTDSVADLAAHRRLPADETGRCAVLYPAIAEAARRSGAEAVGLVDVSCSAALNLNVDRVGITYSDGRVLGDASSSVQQSATVVGKRPVPATAVPEVVVRIGVDADPLDVSDEDDARWLRACISPDDPDRLACLDAEVALAAAAPPMLLSGEAVEVLPDALARVPRDALPVVVTTWALSRLSLENRLRFLHRLDAAAVDRTVALVAVEGVGVAPAVPTLGDRHASGHSIIGLSVLHRATLHAEALGRCWSRGRLLAWLAGS